MTGGGRKGRACIWLDKGETLNVADIQGLGCIRHIWMTFHTDPKFMRGAVIRIYWDGNSYPSMECPLGDFFGVANGRNETYSSLLTAMVEGRGMNMCIPMPFQSARIEVENDSEFPNVLFYQVDYTLGDNVSDMGHLCCTFRRENPTTPKKDFLILERVKGEGRFLGCVVGVRTLEEAWWGEGEVKMYIDGNEEFPTICGTGSEDYILSAWGVKQHDNIYQGCPLYRRGKIKTDSQKRPTPFGKNDLISFYRWHVLDPIYFYKDIKVTMQQIGAGGRKGMWARSDDWSPTAFYYILDPKKLPKIPNRAERLADITELWEGDPRRMPPNLGPRRKRKQDVTS